MLLFSAGSEVSDQPWLTSPGLSEERRRLDLAPLLSHRWGLRLSDPGPVGTRVDAVRLRRPVGEPAVPAPRGARPGDQERLCDRLHLPPLGGQAGQSRAALPAAGLRQGERCICECKCEIKCWIHAATPGSHAWPHTGGLHDGRSLVSCVTAAQWGRG